MALWGNTDVVGSAGTVTLDYSNKTVTGWAGTGTATPGTTFGQVSSAKTGDIIRFGRHGSGTYYGDAVIASIASSTSLKIAGTDGLSGAAIAGVAFSISEGPTWPPADPSFSETLTTAPTVYKINPTNSSWTWATASGIGSHALSVDIGDVGGQYALREVIRVGDYIENNNDQLKVIAVGYCTSRAIATCIPGDYVIRTESPDFFVAGSNVVGLGTTRPTIAGAGETTALTSGAVSGGATIIPLTDGNKYHIMAGDVVKIPGQSDGEVYAKLNNQVSLAATVAAISSGAAITFTSSTINIIANPSNGDETIAVGDTITWWGPGGTLGDVIDLGSDVTGAVVSGAGVTVKRLQDGYDKYVYAVNNTGLAAGTVWEVDSTGWVGVTTYRDTDGELRVKKDVLVSMSGITTAAGAPGYPPENE